MQLKNAAVRKAASKERVQCNHEKENEENAINSKQKLKPTCESVSTKTSLKELLLI